MRGKNVPGWFNAELDWLVNASEGEHGRRAVPLEPSMGGSPDTMDDMRCEAACRARRVTEALRTLPAAFQRLLLAAHEHVSPRRCMAAQDAHKRITDRTADLMAASAAFRRAWMALAPKRAA